MIPEVGHFALILAFCSACGLVILPLGYRTYPMPFLHAFAKKLTQLQCFFMILAFLALSWAFLNHDFSVQYVQENSHHLLPFYYRLTAVWGAHEGSMLLWVMLLSLWAGWVSFQKKPLNAQVHTTILSLLGMICSGLFLFLLLTSNPFLRWLPFFPQEGSDLNPLLQDFGLIVHPPLLYMGYVGLGVPFAAQLSALFYPQAQATLIRWMRPFVLTAWAFLTLGIALGSYWAYYELGWGGYWFWDPVENASLMPWLVTAALVHSLIVTEKRKRFQAWAILLAIYAFALSLIGTFLVRSGVLTSVHAFAVSPERGLYILIFLTLVIGGALTLFCVRLSALKKSDALLKPSKELLLLMNNVFLVVIASTILLGTLYPLIIDALFSEKISVGAPYFNAVFIPMVLPLVILMGIAPSMRFYEDKIMPHLRSHKGMILLLAGAGVGIGFYTQSLAFTAGCLVGLWLLMSTLRLGWNRWRENLLGSRTLGMLIAHAGIGVVILGLSFSHQWSIEKELELSVGDKMVLGPYEVTFQSLRPLKVANYEGLQAAFVLKRQGKRVATLYPERRFYIPRQLMMTETAIHTNPFRDIYIALSEPTGQNRFAVRLYLKPFIVWIWLGGVMVALGALLSALPRQKQGVFAKHPEHLPSKGIHEGLKHAH